MTFDLHDGPRDANPVPLPLPDRPRLVILSQAPMPRAVDWRRPGRERLIERLAAAGLVLLTALWLGVLLVAATVAVEWLADAAVRLLGGGR